MRAVARLVLLGLGVFVAHAVCPVKTPFDSRWSIPIAVSLWRDGDTALGEYAGAIARDDYGIDRIGDRFYGTFPLGVSLLAAPVTYFADRFVRATEPVARANARLRRLWSEWQIGLQPRNETSHRLRMVQSSRLYHWNVAPTSSPSSA